MSDPVDKEFDDIFNPKEDDPENENNKKIITNAFDTIKKYIHKLFLDEHKIPYAAIPIDDHIEVFAINSRNFKDWCRMSIYRINNNTINDQSLNNLCSLLSAHAKFDNKEEVHLNTRISSSRNKINELEWYFDLTNKNWEFVRITSSYWTIIKNEIKFKRYAIHQPQVYPLREYDPDVLNKFLRLVNIKEDDEDSRLNLICYIVCLFIPDIQKPVLMLHGPQGSAKSSLQEMIKMLVDPSIVKIYSFPKGSNELIQLLSHSHVIYFDNISIIRDSLSDQLCRAVSGSGSSKRQLYTDDDDMIYNFKRCVGFNGINLGATKADLLDRGLIILLERISEERRLKPEDLWKEFEEIRPQLLGYIMDILVRILEWKNNPNYPELRLNKLPRMAEFAEYGEMISRLIGNPANKFINSYYRNISLQSQEVIESSVVASAIIQLMNSRNYDDWIGTATSLLSELEYHAESIKINTNGKAWPKAPHILGRRLNEIKVNLNQVGIEIQFGHDGKQRIVMIRKIKLVTLMHLENENQEQKTLFDTNAITNAANDTGSIALDNNGQNQSPSDGINATSATNATLQGISWRI
jgi:hypothetical protein